MMTKRPGLLRREEQVRACVPELLSCRSALYIGARPSRRQIADVLRASGCRVDALEIWPENAAALREKNMTDSLFTAIFEGDVRRVAEIALGPYEAVVWWHGPEHIFRAELPATLAALERIATRVVVLACPFGAVAQSAAYGNPHEEHKTYWLPEDFEVLGFKTSTIGSRDKGGSNILAWRRMA